MAKTMARPVAGQRVSWIAKGKGARLDGVQGKRVFGVVADRQQFGDGEFVSVDGDYKSAFTGHMVAVTDLRVEPARELRDAARATLAIHATCPHCGFNVNILRYEPENGDRYDNGHDRGRGGFRTACESCCEPFVIEADAVHDVQAVALRLLGEA